MTKGRLKGPIDLDKHCGVINDKNLHCSRALTCKSHSMGAKRAVQGRSRPYDELLLALQRLKDPNFVEPAKRPSKAERKEMKEKDKAEKKRRAAEAAAAAAAAKVAAGGTPGQKKGKKAAGTGVTTGSGGSGAAAAAAAAAARGEPEDENMDDVDSEAELDALVRAVRGARASGVIAVPLAVPCDTGTWFVARRERLRNCKDLLSQALASRGGMTSGAGSCNFLVKSEHY